MDDLPHLDFVRRIVASENFMDGPYADYIRSTHGDSWESDILQKAAVIKSIIKIAMPELRIPVAANCVLDGNHRYAIASVLDLPLQIEERLPRQAIVMPDDHILRGRMPLLRLPMDLDFTGETIYEIGSAEGQVAIEAINRGAYHVTAIERDMTSLPWITRQAWGMENRIKFVVADVEKLDPPTSTDALIIGQAICAHISGDTLHRWLNGRRCLLEMHGGEDPPPPTHHRWEVLKPRAYSALPEHDGLRRTVYFGTPQRRDRAFVP